MLSSWEHPLFISELCRKLGFDPLVPTAEQRARLFDSKLIQFKHRTGAYLLTCSSTIGDDQFISRQTTRLLSD